MEYFKFNFSLFARFGGVLLLLFIGMQSAQASHFRFGSLTWEPRKDISPTTVDFTFLGAFRRNAYSGTASDGRPQIGDVIYEGVGGTRLAFDDGSSTSTLYFEIIAYSASENWVLGIARESSNSTGSIRKTYNSATRPDGKPWIANVSGCCRIDLRNSASSYQVRTLVDLSIDNTPPISSIPPIVTCPRGQNCSFVVPASDADKDNLKWRFSTSGESGINSLPSGLVIDSSTGIISWTTTPSTNLGFYAVSVTIEDLTPEDSVKSSVGVDFLINLQDFANNAAPEFNEPPTPPSNITLQAAVGRVFTIDLSASDPDAADTVTLGHVGLPPNAKFTQSPGNPATATFSWIPTTDNLGEQIITFTAIDNHGRATLPRPVKIDVINAEIRNVRVIASVPNGNNIEVNNTGFTKTPSRTEVLGDYTEIEWQFPTFSVTQIENLDFIISAKNLTPGEQRLVTESIELVYEDINGNEVHKKLGQQSASVLPSVFDITVAADKTSYSFNQNAIISTQIRNLSQYDQVSDARVTIQDSNGVIVKDYGIVQDVKIGAEQTWHHPDLSFNTASTYEGIYEIHAQLLDKNGSQIALAIAPLVVVPPSETKVEGSITTDKAAYAPLDTVNVQSRIKNITPNALLDGYTATTTIYNPNNETFWSVTADLPQLLPNAIKDLNYNVALKSALSGSYRAVLIIRDQNGIERSLSETRFTVQSTAITGSGLSGSISVEPNPVLKTEYLNLNATVTNTGNSDLDNLPITISIADPESESVIAEWTSTLSRLAIQGQNNIQTPWQASGPVGTTYLAVLSTQINGKTIYLARTPFKIAEKIDSKLTISDAGRVLVLLDPPANSDPQSTKNTFEDNEELNRQRLYLENLLKDNDWSYTIVTDKDSFARELRSHAYTLYALFSERVKLDEQVQKELREAIFRGDGLLQAGDHDQRYNQLDDALGTVIKGKHNAVTGLTLIESELSLSGQTDWYPDDKPLKAELRDKARAVGHYLGLNAGKTSTLAIAHNAYGEGHTVFVGFDLLAHASIEGADSLYKDLLLAALKDITPTAKTEFTSGDPVAVHLSLTNNGTATSVKTVLTLPAGSEVLDSQGIQSEDNKLTWTIDLAEKETAELTLWLRVPVDMEKAIISAQILIGQAGHWEEYFTRNLTIQFQPKVSFDDILIELQGLTPAHDYQPAFQAINKAKATHDQALYEQSLSFLIQASDSLIRLKTPQADLIRSHLDSLIMTIARKI